MGKERTIHILHVVSKMDRGGVETLLMNVYRNLDKKKIQFDFLTHSEETGDFDKEIQALGGKVYKIPSLGEQGPIRYIKSIMKIMKSKKYVAVHAHTDYQSGFPTLAAKLSGIKIRICHSHSSNWPGKQTIRDKLVLRVLQIMIKISATKLCSCSIEAGEFLFGKNNAKAEILENGIEIRDFLWKENKKQEVILDYNLPNNAKIIGHVGRLSTSKNHKFILKVLKRLIEKDTSFIALLVGDGPLKSEIEREAQALGVGEHVRFLGVRTDIPRLMKTFDVFLFPSFFEGFGIVTIEAQCAGTPCVVSDTVPRTTDMGLGLMNYISLDEDVEVWCSEIKKSMAISEPAPSTIQTHFQKKGFCIQESTSKWLSLYKVQEQRRTSLSINARRKIM